MHSHPNTQLLSDAQGRSFRHLRVSLTAACNYACHYCVPKGKQLHRARHELTAAQFLSAIDALIEVAGISKLRITGGEPLLSPQLAPFLAGVVQRPLDDISITTNGQLLQDRLPLLLDHGVRRINVSLDTLNPVAFQRICRGGSLSVVQAGIDAALAAGLRVKINMVPTRSHNEDQVLPLLEYCLQRGIELRYIELMRMGHLRASAEFSRELVPMQRLLDSIGQRYGYIRASAEYDATAVRFEIPGQGFFGIIANESQSFCASCTRLRLSSAGFLHGCLSSSQRHSIVDLLDMPMAAARPLWIERLQFALADKQPAVFAGGETVMRWIGG